MRLRKMTTEQDRLQREIGEVARQLQRTETVVMMMTSFDASIDARSRIWTTLNISYKRPSKITTNSRPSSEVRGMGSPVGYLPEIVAQ